MTDVANGLTVIQGEYPEFLAGLIVITELLQCGRGRQKSPCHSDER